MVDVTFSPEWHYLEVGLYQKKIKLWYISHMHQDWALLGPIGKQSKNKSQQKKLTVPAGRCLQSYLTSDMVGGEIYNQIDNEKNKKEKTF